MAAWVAGIVEGEGTIVWAPKPPGARRGPNVYLRVKMSDLDVIERLKSWTGIGTITTVRKEVNRKQCWSWTVSRHEDLLSLFDAIEPYLLSRRAGRVVDVRESLHQWRRDVAQRALSCRKGKHLLPNGETRCKPCRNEYAREWRKGQVST